MSIRFLYSVTLKVAVGAFQGRSSGCGVGHLAGSHSCHRTSCQLTIPPEHPPSARHCHATTCLSKSVLHVVVQVPACNILNCMQRS